MRKEDLNALEKDAKAFRDSQEREEALKALAVLRSARSDIEQRRNAATRLSLSSPDFKNYSFVKFVELIAGAVIFLVLCASLIFLVMPAGLLLKGNASTGTFVLLAAALSAVVMSSAILYFLSRKSKKEREALERNVLAKQFARQKHLFQLSVFVLLAFTVFAITLTASVVKEYRVAPYVVSFGFLFGYWVLGRKFWRCPGCGKQLSFMNWFSDRQSIQICPNCHAKLQ